MNETTVNLCFEIKDEQICFNFCDENDLIDINEYFCLSKHQSDEVIWNEGDPCNSLAFIVSGQMEVKKETEFKGKQVMLGLYGAGSMAGELSFLDHKPRSVTAQAISDVVLLQLTHSNFEKLLDDHPTAGIKLLKGILLTVSTRLRKSFDRMITIF